MTEGIAALQAVIEHLERATADAREATRETHSAIKALRQAERDARATARELQEDLGKTMGDQIEQLVERGLVDLRETITTTCETAADKVEALFDQTANVLLFGNAQGRGENMLDRIAAMLALGEAALGRMNNSLRLPRLPPQSPPSPTVKPRKR